MAHVSFLSAVKLALPVCAGIAAGVASSLIASQQAESSQGPRAAVAETRAEAPRPSAAGPRDDLRLRSRLSEVEQKLEDLSSDRGATTKEEQPSEPEAIEASREETVQKVAQQFQAKVERHEREALDAAWAEPAAESFTAGLRGMIGKGSEELRGVECKTASCKATIRFPSYEAARAGFSRYATGFFEIACASSTVLSDPEDPSAPFDVDVLFTDCQRP
jgi:hypothetical protein